MSAYIVDDFHINGLVTWAALQHAASNVSYFWRGAHRAIQGNEARVAQGLYAQNVRSVNHRYNDKTPSKFEFRWVTGSVTNHSAAEIIKACDCYMYQSNETPRADRTEAFAIIQAIREQAVCRVPGYSEAEWGLREPENQPEVVNLRQMAQDLSQGRAQV